MLRIYRKIEVMVVMASVKLLLADYTPTVNEGEARNMIEQFVKPATTLALFAIPIVGILAILIVGIKFFTSDEDTREQKPLGKSVVKLIKWIIILEAIPAILKIFGL